MQKLFKTYAGNLPYGTGYAVVVIAGDFEQEGRRSGEAFVFTMKYPNELIYYVARRHNFESIPPDMYPNEAIMQHMANFADACLSSWLFENEAIKHPKYGAEYRVELQEASDGLLIQICFSKSAKNRVFEMKAVTRCEELAAFIEKYVGRRFGGIDGEDITR